MTFCRMGVALFDQSFHHRDHLGDMIGRMRVDIRRGDAKRGHVFPVYLFEFCRDLANVYALFRGRGVICVDIGNISSEYHPRPLVTQQPDPDIEDDRGPGEPMGIGIDRRSADIHRHPVGLDGNEFSLSRDSVL